MKVSRFLAASIVPFALVVAAGCSSGKPEAQAPKTDVQEVAAQAPASLKYLVNPKREYLGIYTEKFKDNPAAQAKAFKKALGKSPNIVKKFYAFGNAYDAKWAGSSWNTGALPQVEWEPHGVTLKSIVAGGQDAYITKFAQDVAKQKTPVSISFGHEMNGWWYDWGHCRPGSKDIACNVKSTPADFRNAWKKIHGIFAKAGAKNVIWYWSPNVTYPMPKTRLKQFYPGDAYVDWAGVIGYYKSSGYRSFAKLFDPSIKEIRKFTKKPILIGETGVGPGKAQPREITDLLKGVAARKHVIGIIWFNMNKKGELDYRIERNKASLKSFKSGIKKYSFGFNVKVRG